MILPDVNVLIYALQGFTPACGLSCVARGRGDERCPLWLVAIGIGCRRSGQHQSARLPDAQHDRGGVRILRKSARTTPLPDCRAGRAALGYLQATLHRDGNARIPCYRCLVRSARHRMGLRVDHARSRLCKVPEAEVAGADATQRLATSISSARRSSEHGFDIRGRSPVHCGGADIPPDAGHREHV